MPDLGVEAVLDHSETATGTKLSIRFRFSGNVSSAVRRVVDPKKLTWVTNSMVIPAEHRIRFDVLPDYYPDRLECHGSYHFDDDGLSTVLKLEGDLIVRGVPLVGRKVENTILSGFKEHVAAEAELLATWGD